MTTKRTSLDESARAYVTDRLEQGVTMSQLIRSRVDLEEGRFWTYLPTSVEARGLYDFRSGGKFRRPARPRAAAGRGTVAVPVEWAEEETVETIRTFLKGNAGAVFVLENALASRGDPVVSRFRSMTCFVGDDLLHVLRHGDGRDQRAVLRAVKEARTSLEYVGAGCIVEESFEPRAGATISSDRLEALVARLQILIVGAYDGESFVLWKRRQRVSRCV